MPYSIAIDKEPCADSLMKLVASIVPAGCSHGARPELAEALDTRIRRIARDSVSGLDCRARIVRKCHRNRRAGYSRC
jgi:hypothetical protein